MVTCSAKINLFPHSVPTCNLAAEHKLKAAKCKEWTGEEEKEETQKSKVTLMLILMNGQSCVF